ncbi:MAG: KOW domain-containing RNA-binding protein [Lachnospiraceae bacterium]|nr:KOW domain-containing RNA-binding protein [Lachnospiraceae bacterium]
MTGNLVSIKTGTDKNKIFYIIKEDGPFLWLADGRKYTLQKPARKNRKHVQLIKSVYGIITTDEEIVQTVTTYLSGRKTNPYATIISGGRNVKS